MTKDELRVQILENPDFINAPRFENSIKRAISNKPDGFTDKQIAQMLMVDEEEVEKLYQSAIMKIKASLKP